MDILVNFTKLLMTSSLALIFISFILIRLVDDDQWTDVGVSCAHTAEHLFNWACFFALIYFIWVMW